MYNILLTDDEQIVIDSLSFIINKNFEGQFTIHTALSGTKALEVISKENIDIIFMDINMPGLSGLETVSCITKIKPEIIIIILSAFDKFQYAQEAMNLGVFKYITKPVNRNIVIQTIKSTMEIVDNRRGLQIEDNKLHQKLDMFSPMIENDFILTCSFNYDKNIDLQAYLDYFNIPETCWCFCCFDFPNISTENQEILHQKIKKIINQKHSCLISSFMMNRIVVYYPVYSQEIDITENIKDIYLSLSMNITNGIKAGISNTFSDPSMLPDSYSQALLNLNRTSTTGGITFCDTTYSAKESERDVEQIIKKQLFLKLKQGDASGVKSCFDLLSTQIFITQTNMDIIKNKLFELTVTSYNIVTEIIPEYTNNEYQSVFAILSKENNSNSLRNYIQKMLLEFTASISNRKNQIENPAITKVCNYIINNLQKDLSLEEVADYANISTFYLSKIFKEEKGISFINYLTDKRLEKAREYLSNQKLSIKEITSMIGYNDQNYFSRLFKNKFGISPSEYRNTL